MFVLTGTLPEMSDSLWKKLQYNYATKRKYGTDNFSGVRSLVINPNGNLLVVGGGAEINVWNVNTGRKTLSYIPIAGDTAPNVYSLAINKIGNQIASVSGGNGRGLDIWDIKNVEVISTILKKKQYDKINSEATSVAFLNNKDNWVITGDEDNTVNVWKESNNNYKNWDCRENDRKLEQTLIDPNNSTFVKNIKTGLPTTVRASHSAAVNCVAVSGNGSIIVSGSTDKTVKIWAGTKHNFGTHLHTFDNTFVVTCIAINHFGTRVASGGRGNNVVHIWDTSTTKILQKLSEHTNPIRSIAFNKDDKLNSPLILTTSEDGTIKIWQVETGKLIQSIILPLNVIANCAIFSPNGKTIYAGLNTGQIKRWDYYNSNDEQTNFLMSVKKAHNNIRARNERKKMEDIAKTAKRSRSLPRSRKNSSRKTNRSAPTTMDSERPVPKGQLNTKLLVNKGNEDLDKVIASFLPKTDPKPKYDKYPKITEIVYDSESDDEY